jgi:copper chaperone CopZ
VRVAIQQVNGVQAVDVSFKDGLTEVDLSPGNAVTLARLRQVIKTAGFSTTEASLIAVGEPAGARGFVVGRTDERITLAAAPQRVAAGWKLQVPAPAP